MQIRTSYLTLQKRYPLAISRGVSAGSENLLVEIEHEGIVGLGEMAPFHIGAGVAEEAVTARADIEGWREALGAVAPWEMQRVEAIWEEGGGGRGAQAALDMAMHDWLGKKTGLPVYRLLGGDPARIASTSLTIGINPPEVIRERVPEILARTGAAILKIKLGAPAGIEADQAMFAVVQECAPSQVALRVDANGGWTVPDARAMIRWLAARNVEYVEQPLPRGQEADLPALHRDSPLPLFADESVCVAADAARLADCVDGINLKLMKAGGIREGLRVIHTARAHGLQVMLGCMSESSLAIAASAHLASFADYLDLDSHLNLLPDPFAGLLWQNGRTRPSDRPGLGVYPADTAT